MSGQPREVLLVGSVPLRPAAKVFEAVGAHLGPLAPRIPDGEMMGWLREVWASHARNPARRKPRNGRANLRPLPSGQSGTAATGAMPASPRQSPARVARMNTVSA